MKEHFVNYNQALALKELGFDEPCIARYIIPGDLVFKGCYEDSNIIHLELTQNDICEAHVLAPLKSQVFEWARDEYGLYHIVHHFEHNNNTPKEFLSEVTGKLLMGNDDISGFSYHSTYKEAESACIDTLLEIIKEKKS
jgi:hypothetical protein